ncbi:MAG: MBL fold metallo-hydrolase [Longimicrobiales bacterium]
MKLRFLGTGTSFGIPVIGCGCATCNSTDPRDRRTRHGALIRSDDNRRALLVDTPPELRLQLLEAGVSHIDAVWYTHAHADHTHGIDDLRVFGARSDQRLPIYADPACAQSLVRRFDYIFDESRRAAGSPRALVELRPIGPVDPIEVAGFSLTPLPVPHGDIHVFGFRVGSLGYLTDAKELTDQVRARLAGVRYLVLNALWFGRAHPTHFNIEEAVEAARAVRAEQTYLTHLTHRVSHADLAARLPAGIAPAYDNLEIEF